MLVKTQPNIVEGNSEILAKSFEKGMYQQAADEGVPFGAWLESFIQEKEGGNFEPTVYNGMTTFEMYRERASMKANGQSVPINAYEIALLVSGIKAYGSNTDTVEKFYQTQTTKILFPWFMQDRIYAGAITAGIWQNFIAEIITIDGQNFRKIYLDDTEGERQMGRGGRGGPFPRKQFSVSKHDMTLEKYGIQLEFDYEVIFDTPIALYAKTLQRVGQQIGVDETNDFFYCLVNGDGNSNGLESAQTKTTQTTTTISKHDIIQFACACPVAYPIEVFAGPTTQMVKFWDTLSDMTNPVSQRAQIGIPLPDGYRWDSGQMSSVTDRLYGVNKANGISYVTNDTMNLTETDKIITKQSFVTVISKRGLFTVDEQDAIGCLDINH